MYFSSREFRNTHKVLCASIIAIKPPAEKSSLAFRKLPNTCPRYLGALKIQPNHHTNKLLSFNSSNNLYWFKTNKTNVHNIINTTLRLLHNTHILHKLIRHCELFHRCYMLNKTHLKTQEHEYHDYKNTTIPGNL